jgi:hypothetical protein
MALKFKCGKCEEDIITKFVKIGEIAQCRNCGAETMVPENAIEVDEEPKYKTPTVTRQDAVTKVKDKVRPIWDVLLLSIITLSIYFWVYLFKTLREMKNTFTFEAQEINPDKVRPILITYLIVTIIWVISVIAISVSLGFLVYIFKTYEFYVLEMIGTVISTALFVAFFLSFVKLIEVCQKKGGMVPLNKSIFWTVIAISAVISFVYIGIPSLSNPVPLVLVDVVVNLVLIYLIVKQVNRIWEESHL